jgi:preprotein translocase subunit SecF
MLPDITGRKWWYFLISGLLIVPGVVFLLLGGLKLGIEFQGGTLLDVRFAQAPPSAEVAAVLEESGRPEAIVQGAEGERVLARTLEMDPAQIEASRRALAERFGENYLDLSAGSVSPSFSTELLRNAFYAIVAASAFIVFLIAFAFRNFGWDAFVYGVAAIIALLHDALLVIGLWAILGYFFQIEVDSLFVTALLTVIGFSVHDTIVVFDRVRENLRLNPGEPLNAVINFSIVQTMVRSIITSLTIVLTLLALFLFGGYSIRNFALALLVGAISGTYSSIFNAAQLVSLWHELRDSRRQRRIARATA